MNEQEHLRYTLDKYDEVIEDSNLKLNNLSKFYQHDYDSLLEEKEKLEYEIKTITKAKLNPYFARIDFEANNKEICYIGKKGVTDFDNNIITIDWRAPISSLYYDSNIGNASYKSPSGIIEGKLTLKRQYIIEDSKLISYTDVDTVSNDELLKPYLSVTANDRLKNIISTIQSEQNEIIRKSIKDNIIVQGVAGSGKTTVALHRIAYLVYNHKDIYKNNQYMIIGPNKFFMNYISSVLPDLDVSNVNQFDLIDFTSYYLGTKLNIKDGYTDDSKYKSSKEFINKIDEYFDNYHKNILPNEDITINNNIIVKNEVIKRIWNELESKNYETIKDRVDRTLLLLNKYISDNKIFILNNINNYYDDLLLTNKLEVVRKERTNTLNEFNKNLSYYIKKYFNKIYKDAISIYKEIIKIDKLYFEDISPLIYINYKLYGSKEYDNIRHLVIDEAQDYNDVTFYSFTKIFKNASISIFGDIAQAIYPYRSITSWDSVKSIMDVDVLELTKSYRTTKEIMNEANKINKYLHLTEATPVIREGKTVSYVNDISVDYIEKTILNFKNSNYHNIAIICKDDKEVENLYCKLKDKVNVNLINKDNNYEDGILLISSSTAKGLEFDAVIIYNVDKKIFDKDNITDMKLLYVSITRAMHELVVLYENELVDILK